MKALNFLYKIVCFIILSVVSCSVTHADNHISAPLPLQEPDAIHLPEVGEAALKVISPSVLELMLTTTKAPDPAGVTTWNFVDSNYGVTLPSPSQLTVLVNGTPAI